MNNGETNQMLYKRNQRLQPMVMVWNTYFPNGKMIPLRQPQPPVYFGPVMQTSNGNPQPTQSIQAQEPQPQQQQIMRNVGNNYVDNNQEQNAYKQEIFRTSKTSQMSNENTCSKGNVKESHSNNASKNGLISNNTNEIVNNTSHCPSPPMFPNTELPVIGAV